MNKKIILFQMKMRCNTASKAGMGRLMTLLLGLMLSLNGFAQSKYRLEVPAPPAKLLNGIAVGVDGVGFGMKIANTSYANMEVFGRVNLLEKYFPVVELGLGDCDREGKEQNNHFHTRAPYYRVGMDYCLTKKRNGNRLLLGLRYGFSNYDYNYVSADFQDPVWVNSNTSVGIDLGDIQASSHWMEFCFGIETKLWRYIRMGWSLRYKARLHQSNCPNGDPWFVPGFGKNDSVAFGGTFNLVFEFQRLSALNFAKKKLADITKQTDKE